MAAHRDWSTFKIPILICIQYVCTLSRRLMELVDTAQVILQYNTSISSLSIPCSLISYSSIQTGAKKCSYPIQRCRRAPISSNSFNEMEILKEECNMQRKRSNRHQKILKIMASIECYVFLLYAICIFAWQPLEFSMSEHDTSPFPDLWDFCWHSKYLWW